MTQVTRPIAFQRIARAVRLGSPGDDREEVVQSFLDWVENGCRGDLDDALGVIDVEMSREERLAKRDRLVREFFACFSDHVPHEQVARAYKRLKNYWEQKHDHHKGTIEGGFAPKSRDHLCWEIFDVHPQLFSGRQFRKIVTGR